MKRYLYIPVILLSLCIAKVDAKYEFLNIYIDKDKLELQEEIILKITSEHFFEYKDITEINSNFQRILIESLDPNKTYFTNDELNIYASSNNQEKIFDLNQSFKILNFYFNRLIEATNFQIETLQHEDFNFYKNDFLDIFAEDNDWQLSKDELKNNWYLTTKSDLLNEIISDTDDIDIDEKKSALIKRYENRIKMILQRNNEDFFSLVMNTYTNQFDPHSAYLSPQNAEDFDMQMSLKLEGIGALLGIEDDFAKVVSLIPGGPAEKSKEIFADDKIVSIRQYGEKDKVEVIGWRIDEIVKLIRGDAGSKVELEVISSKSDSPERKIVTLTREEVKLEEQAAKSKIFNLQNNEKNIKLGVIELPAFYIDFNAWRDRDPDFRSSSKDVEKILVDFNEQNVDALIVDLRGNSGGSMYEANRLTGLFIASGATVQVKESSGSIRPWGDGRAVQVWKKPLGVLVNRYSASASEIFAGAIQDYKRGIIIGHRTFGKGTVQRLDDLTSGQIKITESKFYRVNGSSTQSRGIVPDVMLPSTWDIEETGESSLDHALPWDNIKPIRHRTYNVDNYTINNVLDSFNLRMKMDPNLQYLLRLRERYEEQKNKKKLSLNIKQRKIDKEERKEWLLQVENTRRSLLGIDTFNNYEELENFRDEIDQGIINLENDHLLNESTKIMKDFINYEKMFLISGAA
ncbi:MAG: tail-specific protease [Gammaproteobacteria bacterium]|nr:MAG: tail-specific protease [Gammaproteobacteria bacterium]